jgi:general secretion pathway protein J
VKSVVKSQTYTTEDGFTLVELLVALTLMGLLSLVLFGGLHFGRRVWEASEAETAADNRIRAFQVAFAELLARAYPEVNKGDPSRRAIEFAGEPARISFLTPDPNASGQLIRATFSKHGSKLLEAVASELAREKSETIVDPRLPEIARLRFAYYGVLLRGQKPAWHAQWTDTTMLPERVSVHVDFAERRLAWPELVVRPRIAADVSCSFDALTRTCQGL